MPSPPVHTSKSYPVPQIPQCSAPLAGGVGNEHPHPESPLLSFPVPTAREGHLSPHGKLAAEMEPRPALPLSQISSPASSPHPAGAGPGMQGGGYSRSVQDLTLVPLRLLLWGFPGLAVGGEAPRSLAPLLQKAERRSRGRSSWGRGSPRQEAHSERACTYPGTAPHALALAAQPLQASSFTICPVGSRHSLKRSPLGGQQGGLAKPSTHLQLPLLTPGELLSQAPGPVPVESAFDPAWICGPLYHLCGLPCHHQRLPC